MLDYSQGIAAGVQHVLFHSLSARVAVWGSQHWENSLLRSTKQLLLFAQLWQPPLSGAGVPLAEGMVPLLISGMDLGAKLGQGMLHDPLLLSL